MLSYRVRQHNFLISKINKTIYIYITYLLFFYNIGTSLNFFFTLFWISHQVGDAFEEPFPVATHFNEGLFRVPVCFPDLFPCECQYIRWYAGEGHFMANCMIVMQCIVYRLHKPISGVCHGPHQTLSGNIGTHKETKRENGLAWVAAPNLPLWKWGAGENVLSKSSPTWYNI